MIRQMPVGHAARVTYYRMIEGHKTPLNRARMREGDKVLQHGGGTLVEIIDADGTVVGVGNATCRPDETFDHKLGRTIALGRALCDLDGTMRERFKAHARKVALRLSAADREVQVGDV